MFGALDLHETYYKVSVCTCVCMYDYVCEREPMCLYQRMWSQRLHILTGFLDNSAALESKLFPV